MDKKSSLDEALALFQSKPNAKYNIEKQMSLVERDLILGVDTLFFDIIREFGMLCVQSATFSRDIWDEKFIRNFFASISELYENHMGSSYGSIDISIEKLEKKIVALYECREKIIGLIDEKLNSESFNAILRKNEIDLIEYKDSYIENVNLYHDLISTHMKKLFNEQIIYLKRKIRQIKDRPRI
ncbi:MAG: hypothetical protein HFK08_01755 [Clostridia bacterium]|nr:hypothetical protein [Clostridia bacterium]